MRTISAAPVFQCWKQNCEIFQQLLFSSQWFFVKQYAQLKTLHWNIYWDTMSTFCTLLFHFVSSILVWKASCDYQLMRECVAERRRPTFLRGCQFDDFFKTFWDLGMLLCTIVHNLSKGTLKMFGSLWRGLLGGEKVHS